MDLAVVWISGELACGNLEDVFEDQGGLTDWLEIAVVGLRQLVLVDGTLEIGREVRLEQQVLLQPVPPGYLTLPS